MKVVIAMDSFKGSMSSMEAGIAAKEGIARACDAEVVVKPMADGGEGTTEALVEGLGGTFVSLEVTGPLGGKINVKYGILQEKKMAVIEMAEAAGITLVKQDALNPSRATTYGVGMLQALGAEILGRDRKPIALGIQDLDSIATINTEKMPKELQECHFQIACDVRNPLCSENGAVYVFGAQKGVREEEKKLFDRKMAYFAEKTKEYIGNDYKMAEGAGAAFGYDWL